MFNIFWGEGTPHQKIAAILFKSDIVINSFVNGALQRIENEVGDHLASGKPMINELETPVFCRLVELNNVETNIEPEDIEELLDINNN